MLVVFIGFCDSHKAYVNSMETVETGNTYKKNIGVCIGGQIGRLMPHFLNKDLVQANSQYFFHIFYNLDDGKRVVFNTGDGYSPTKYYSMTKDQIKKELTKTYSNKNSKLHIVKFHKPTTNETFIKMFQVESLDRIVQYIYTQHTILNMYNFQVTCAQQIIELEDRLKIKFDFIISTREDIYFFKPLNLTFLENYLITTNETNSKKCQLLTKACLSWGGVNMRFQFYERNSGVSILNNRFLFYQSMYKTNTTAYNPEQFEQFQLDTYNIKNCPINITDFALTAARHVKNNKICFIDLESSVENCIPDNFEKFVNEHRCV